jgi:hypothetical protein
MMARLLTILTVALLVSGLAFGQNPASNKAFFVAGTDSVTIAGVGAVANPVLILDAPSAFKTSTNGAGEFAVSLECALWTYNTVTATVGRREKHIQRPGLHQGLGGGGWSGSHSWESGVLRQAPGDRPAS